MKIYRTYTLHSARFIPTLDTNHPCSKMHGHTFKIIIEIDDSIDEYEEVSINAGLILQFNVNIPEEWAKADTIIKEIIYSDTTILYSVFEIKNSQSMLLNGEPLSFWYDPSTYAFAFIQNTTLTSPDGTGEGFILINGYNTLSTEDSNGDILALIFNSNSSTDINVNNIKVVPNPYLYDSQFDGPSNQVRFTHLPEQCNITIFSIDGDSINTLSHNSQLEGYEWWDLSNIQGEQINSGIYKFQVTSINGNFYHGVFVYP